MPQLCRIGLALAALRLVVAAGEGPLGDSGPWLRILEGPSYGALFDAVLTDDRHAIAVGATNHVHMPPYSGDALILMVDVVDGATVWERTWGGDGYEQAWGVDPAPGGGYYVFGETDSRGAGDRDFFLLKVSADGDEVWSRTYGTRAREWPFGMLPLANGDLLLFGRTVPEGGSEDAYALRVDPDGRVVWEYTEHTTDDVLILDALETAAGQLVLCTAVARDGALTALAADGHEIWTRRYELEGWQFASSIAAAADGYLLAGFSMTEDGSRRQADVWLAKASASGDLEWHTSFGEAEDDDYAQSLYRVSDGAYLIGGLGRGMPLWKIDASGAVLWERRLDDSSVYAATSAIELPDGGFLVTGLKSIVNGRSYDAALARSDAQGRVWSSADAQHATGPYLGQSPPGRRPEVFAPGIVSTGDPDIVHGNIAIAPDGREIVWSFFQSADRTFRTWHSRQVGGRWTAREPPPFTADGNAFALSFAPDGQRLFFTSNRPWPQDWGAWPGPQALESTKIWYVDRVADGWSGPRILDRRANHGLRAVSPAVDGTLYTAGIRRIRTVNGDYGSLEGLPPPLDDTGRSGGGHPFVAPDESYVVFNDTWQDHRGYGIFISYQLSDGHWTDPVNLCEVLQMARGGSEPMVSPDGRFLFFYANHDIYWVDAGVIEEIRARLLSHPSEEAT